jgi:hypothetical protein
MLHATPWAHIKIDPTTGNAIECENPYPTPESLYKLCDEEHVYESFKNDLVVQITVARWTGRFEHSEGIEQLCKTLNISGDLRNPDDCKRIAAELLQECAFRATMYSVDKAREFTKHHNKKLLILLSYGQNEVMGACNNEPRFDQPIIDYLTKNGIPYVDTLQKHAEDYQSFRISPEDYAKRYYIGHYRAQGNHFFAFAIKDAVVAWLDPNPPAFELV